MHSSRLTDQLRSCRKLCIKDFCMSTSVCSASVELNSSCFVLWGVQIVLCAIHVNQTMYNWCNSFSVGNIISIFILSEPDKYAVKIKFLYNSIILQTDSELQYITTNLYTRCTKLPVKFQTILYFTLADFAGESLNCRKKNDWWDGIKYKSNLQKFIWRSLTG